MKKLLIFFIIIDIIIIGISITTFFINKNKFDKDILIGHAFGTINDDAYTNSREAFDNAYQRRNKNFRSRSNYDMWL